MDKTPYKNTLEWFKSLSANDDTDECLKAVLPAIMSLQIRLRRKDDVVDDIPVLSYAAALLAMYRGSINQELFGLSSFKAGDITVKTTTKEERNSIIAALNLAFGDARPYLKTGVVFKNMDGGKI